MLQVTIAVNDQGQLHLNSNAPSRDVVLDLLIESLRVIRADMQKAAKEAAPRVVTAPEGVLRALPKIGG